MAEALAALFTLERFLSTMKALMFGEMMLMFEGLRAHVTSKWTGPCKDWRITQSSSKKLTFKKSYKSRIRVKPRDYNHKEPSYTIYICI